MIKARSEALVFELGPIFGALDVGIIVVDTQNRVVVWNDWIAAASKIPAETAMGNDLLDLFPSARNTRLPAAIRDAFESGSASVLTHTLNKLLVLYTESGGSLIHNIIARPVVQAAGSFCLLQINDVTMAVMREKVLRERQNARYHAIAESAPDAIITISMDRKIQWVNGAAEHVFGYQPAELLGQRVEFLLANEGDLAGLFHEDDPDVRSSASSIQLVGLRKNGLRAFFDVSYAHWTADGRIFVTTIWRDVTDRKAAENALRESEALHRTLSEALPQLVWTCDGSGACDYINPQWRAYTGVALEEPGFNWLDAVHHDDRAHAAEAWKSALQSRATFDVDVRLRQAGGAYRWFKMRSIPVRNDDGTVSKWFGTATDITANVEARDALRRSNEELEALVAERTSEREAALSQLHESQKMETIGQLTGGVAHDFNNLLAVILGSLSLLKKGLPSDPRTSRLLEGAIQGAERGATLTKRLLAFARRQELKLEAVEVQKLVPDILEFLRQSIGPSISIIVEIPPDVHPVKIDANQLELALMNLAVNARDAMPDGGTLTITCRNVSTDDELPKSLARGEYVRVTVADTGEGMNEATLAKAMEPFFTTKGVGKGTGLGLSMVQGLTAQCGGAMHITSQLGRGTAVSLWLPRATPEEMKDAAPDTSAPALDTSRQILNVLLVDDDHLVSTNTAFMLSDLGHTVTEAESGKRALELLKAGGQYDLVITDYAMPGMNGLDLALTVQKLKPGMPIILATGYAELAPGREQNFPRLGKPFTLDQLTEVVEEAVAGATGHSSPHAH